VKVGHIIAGGKFPVVTPIDGPQKFDWLRTGQGVEVLGRLADQDGWNGETEVRTMTNQHLAVPADNIELTLVC
jgi:hypothetical protein